MKRDRLFALLTALALLLTVLPALAEDSHALRIFDAGKTLLTSVSNVTVKGEAAFYLDDNLFKTAYFTHIQDGTDSYWQEDLVTPKRFHLDRRTGFTVIKNGTDVFVMEPCLKGSYLETSTYSEMNTILRDTGTARMTLSMLRAVVAALGPALDRCIEKSADGTEYLIALDEGEAPALLNSAFALGMQFAGRRLFDIDNDFNLEVQYTHEYMNTPTRVILWMTDAYTIGKSSAQVVLDSEGRLSSLKGEANVGLHLIERGEHTLRVTFSMDVSEYGTSEVELFSPDKYNVRPLMSRYRYEKQPEQVDAAASAGFLQRARDAFKAAGYADTDALEIKSCIALGDRYLIDLTNSKDKDHHYGIQITDADRVISLCRTPFTGYRDQETDEQEPRELTDAEIEKITAFVRAMNPELRLDDLIMEELIDSDGGHVIVVGELKSAESLEEGHAHDAAPIPTSVSLNIWDGDTWFIQDFDTIY